MTVGFIGLGIMGKPMALNLVRRGHELLVHSRSDGPVAELVAAGARAASSAGSVARDSDVVITMLPDDATVEGVVTEMVRTLRRDALVIDMSTTAPGLARRLSTLVAAAGGTFLDAPVSGGETGAREATLAIMAGGDRAAFDRAGPILHALGNTVVYAGAAGAGQVAKACNQLVVLATIEVVAEALVLAARAGVDPAVLRGAMLGGFAASRVLELHGRRMLERDFRPGGRASLHLKDVDIVLGMARESGVPVRSFEAAAATLDELIARGGGGLDHAALVTVIEAAADRAAS
ncbi:2-hydroxy-3-oxopropionate reductase [soil metagenome]